MTALIGNIGQMQRSFGSALVSVFFLAVAGWAALLIVFPQLVMLDSSLTRPARQLDSAIAAQLAADAATCITILEQYQPSDAPAAPASSGGLAIPSPSTTAPSAGLAIPSPSTTAPSSGGLAIPSPGSTAGSVGGRPYILQCDRTSTELQLVRDEAAGRVLLDVLYDLPKLGVDETAPIDDQIAQAREIGALAEELVVTLRAQEATAFRWSLTNYEVLTAARAIPMEPATLAVDSASLENKLYSIVGLRYVEDGVVHKRLALITLARTIVFAIMATALALIICYPIAYNLALKSTKEKAVWLFLGLVIPYAIVELMRVYAWVSIIETNGLFNAVLDWIGVLSIAEGEAIPFKRYPLTVFLVIVYTYILFMAFPIVNVMSTLDRNQIEAARDLGASTWRVHWRVVIPHTKPGIAVGCISTFMLAAGAFSVPRIISRGLQGEWFSQTIYNKYFESGNSEVGAAYAFAFILLCFVIVAIFMRVMNARLKDFVRA